MICVIDEIGSPFLGEGDGVGGIWLLEGEVDVIKCQLGSRKVFSRLLMYLDFVNLFWLVQLNKIR